MLEDLDLEKSWAYQEILHKGIEKEQQKWLTAQRDALLNVVQMRFPELLVEARKKADQVTEPLVLQDIMLKIVAAHNREEAGKHLL